MSYNMDLNKGTTFQNLQARHFETKLKMAPLSTFKDIEWNGEASPWITDAQEFVAAFPKNLTTSVTIYNIGYTDQRPFEKSKPSVLIDDEEVVNIITTSNVEFPFNPIDISAFMNSANEIAGKMKSQKAIMRIVKGDGYGDSATCRAINEVLVLQSHEQQQEQEQQQPHRRCNDCIDQQHLQEMQKPLRASSAKINSSSSST
ncbi:uncharacterized protein LOC121420120 [Lytechinus variegatus]|uniref:uncharacterized protein LOC121420120 n=1 Tax=Lytechinus variegatus TaxID=7654 RepID=UPI001BB1839B|nr:uncharacterized protein LOC121420120 [Lytechinus variegatus]